MIKTFLNAGDVLGAFLAGDYMPSPSRAEYHQLMALARDLVGCLDLSEVPPAARVKTGRAAALALYTTLSRIQLPPFEEIPDGSQGLQSSGTNAAYWVIPHTEIVLVQVRCASPGGAFLFSADTVARAEEFHRRVRDLPCTRPVPLKNLGEIAAVGGGWMIPHGWVVAMPEWLRASLAGQAIWKWIVLGILLAGALLLLRLAWRFSRRGTSEHPVVQALARLLLPAFVLVTTPIMAYLGLVQLNLSGKVGSVIELTSTALLFLAGAWISWRAACVVAEAIIASPNIAPESIDAHLIRICTRLLGIVAGVSLLVMGADRLGLPLYGILAGLGIGGLAIALAAQPTIENLIGGLSLFADKPIRVGDACRYGSDIGKIEAIGIRSTRIRGTDRTLTTIPNAALSRMPVVNLSRGDAILMKSVLNLRYETSPEQLRHILAQIRQMLSQHPSVSRNPFSARFAGFAASSLDVHVSAYVTAGNWTAFLGIQEELHLRIMDIVQESGTGFAFPSQTLYLARDKGPNLGQAEPATTRPRPWHPADQPPGHPPPAEPMHQPPDAQKAARQAASEDPRSEP